MGVGMTELFGQYKEKRRNLLQNKEFLLKNLQFF